MKKGMIKVSVMYPNGAGKHFDMDYYKTKHAALIGPLLGDAVKGVNMESGLGGGPPGSSAPFAAIGTMYFDSLEAFQTAFVPHAETIMADTPNYTNIEPIMQIGELTM